MNRIGQAVLAVCALLAFFASAVHAADVQGKKITLPATERQVNVTLFKAPGDAQRPSVLLLHGAGGFDRRIADYNRYASALANQGMDAYLVYYYSDADEKSMSFGVDVFENRYAAWAKTVGDLADYLEKQKDSNGKVGLVGFSNGGILATGASTLDPNITAAVIYYGTEPWPLASPAKRFPPLLILHGDADQIIPVDNGRHLAALAKQLGGRVDMVIYPGEMHGFGADFTKKNAADALNHTIVFLRKELQGK
jgi:carboxymethylenebutenolidase